MRAGKIPSTDGLSEMLHICQKAGRDGSDAQEQFAPQSLCGRLDLRWHNYRRLRPTLARYLPSAGPFGLASGLR